MWEENCQEKQKNNTTEANISCHRLLNDIFDWDTKLLIKHLDLCFCVCARVCTHTHVHTNPQSQWIFSNF